MIVRPSRNYILLCTSAMLVGASLLVSTRASAQALCAPVDITPPAVAAVFDVEGKITAFDRTSRTLTANGLTFTVPSVLLVETRDLDLTGNITFDTLTDPTLEAQRSIIGGTVIATGTVSFTAVGAGFCTSSTAAQVFVELAENGLVGLLSNIDPVNGSFRVNGALVRMNTDPRFPSDLLDIGGGSITVADLVGFEGTEVSAGGYFDAAQGVLFGTAVETEALQLQPGSDTVAITRAEGRTGNAELPAGGLEHAQPADRPVRDHRDLAPRRPGRGRYGLRRRSAGHRAGLCGRWDMGSADTSHRTDTEPGLRPIAARRRDHAGGHVEIAQRSRPGAPGESVQPSCCPGEGAASCARCTRTGVVRRRSG